MLTWHNVWMASHGREMARDTEKPRRHDVHHAASAPWRRSPIVVGVAVLREGSEVVLFLYGIMAQGGTTNAALSLGGGAGPVLGRRGAYRRLMYFGLLDHSGAPAVAVTSGLITLLAAGMAAQAVLFLQNGGYINALTDTVWNTAWLLSEESIAGRLLHTLVGYSDAPDGAQLIAYLATIALVLGLMRLVERAPAGPRPAPVPAE